jgi:hypothetical protein
MNAYRSISCASLLAFGALVAASDAQAADAPAEAPFVSAAAVGATNDTFYRPPIGGLSAANSDTRDLNRPVLVLQAGRSF